MSPDSTDTPTTPVADLLRDLVHLRVLAPKRAAWLYANLAPRLKDHREFIGHLVQRGELTRFQADKLLRGQGPSLVLGPYQLLGPLGRGGMGLVYLARRGPEGEPVALKVLPPARARDRPRTLVRFQRESEIGLRLPPHPNLARTTDAGESAGVHYLAMEYVPGRTVKQIVAGEGPLPVGRAARVFADVAAALQVAHDAGLVHRDLKPANVIVTPEGRAKLLDLGFALIRGESAPTDPALLGGPGYTLGTMDYLAPEQAADPIGVGPAADLYSLGCSIYFALAGCPPFPGGTALDKIRWHRSDQPPPLEQINPAVPAEFAGLVYQLMEKRAEDRPPSAAEVAGELERWADPVPAKPFPTEDWHQRVDAEWEAVKLRAEGTAESAVLTDEPAPPGLRTSPLPRWAVGIGIGVTGAAIALAALLGWLLARWVGP